MTESYEDKIDTALSSDESNEEIFNVDEFPAEDDLIGYHLDAYFNHLTAVDPRDKRKSPWDLDDDEADLYDDDDEDEPYYDDEDYEYLEES